MLAIQLLEERLTESDMQDGWVLSGFPRNMNQAAGLNAMLLDIAQPYDVVIHLQGSDLRQKPTPVDAQLMSPDYLVNNAVLKTPLGSFYSRLNQLVSISSNTPLATIDNLLQSLCIRLAES